MSKCPKTEWPALLHLPGGWCTKGRGLDKQEAGLHLHLPSEEHSPNTLDFPLWDGMVLGWEKACCIFECSGKEEISWTSSSGSWSRTMNSRTTDTALLVLSYSAFHSLLAAVSTFPSTLPLAPSSFHESSLRKEEPEGTKEHKRIFHRQIRNYFETSINLHNFPMRLGSLFPPLTSWVCLQKVSTFLPGILLPASLINGGLSLVCPSLFPPATELLWEGKSTFVSSG